MESIKEVVRETINSKETKKVAIIICVIATVTSTVALVVTCIRRAIDRNNFKKFIGAIDHICWCECVGEEEPEGVGSNM